MIAENFALPAKSFITEEGGMGTDGRENMSAMPPNPREGPTQNCLRSSSNAVRYTIFILKMADKTLEMSSNLPRLCNCSGIQTKHSRCKQG